MRSPEVSAAIRSSFAVGLAVAAYGVSFGALSVAAGLDVWQTCVLSLLMFSGGSQFALVGVIATGGASAGGAAIASAVLLGTRNSLYALRVAPMIGPRFLKRLLAGHWTIDESTAVSTAQPTLASQRAGFWWTGARGLCRVLVPRAASRWMRGCRRSPWQRCYSRCGCRSSSSLSPQH